MRGLGQALLLGAVLALAAAPPAGAAVDPPAAVTGSSPFPPRCNGATQGGTEYRHAEVEPWIDANPRNPDNLVGVWQQDRYSDGGANGLGVGVSRDGGASWSQVPLSSLPKFARCQGAAEGSSGDYERASDPWVSFGPDGDAYQVSLSFNRTRDAANAILVSESKDGGRSWGPGSVLRRDTSSLVFNDKESITADPTDSRYAYAVWDRLEQFPDDQSYRGPTWFARTTNGGASWEPGRQIFDPGRNDQTVGNQIVVLPNGDLVNAYALFDDGLRGVAVVRSSDQGASWSEQVVVNTFESVGVRDPRDGQPVRTGDIIPAVAADERPGTDNVYLVWQDARFTGGQRDQIAFSRSSDGGATWSAPKRISTEPSTQAFTPAIRVDDQGNLGVTYYDFRHDTPGSPTLDSDVWFLHSTDKGETFTEERLTPSSFDMRAAPVARGFFVGDYAGLAARTGVFQPLFAQAGAGSPTDVFATTVRAPFGPPAPVPPAGEPAPPAPAPQPPAAGPQTAQALIRVGRRGSLRRGTAFLRLRCSEPQPCTGVVRLTTVVSTRGRRRRPLVLGARSFQLRRGTATLRVRLHRRPRRLIGRRKRVLAQALLMVRGDRPTFRVLLRRR